jgi:hypothetical protein
VSTDAALKAEILSYSRAHGLFAGIDLSGGVLRPDEDANRDVYGPTATPRTILASREISAPTQAAAFLNALAARSSTAASATTAQPPSTASSSSTAYPSSTASQGMTPAASASDADLRARIAEIQQTLNGLLAGTAQEPVGTTGASTTRGAIGTTSGATGGVMVDRATLQQLRQQLDALSAALDRRR